MTEDTDIPALVDRMERAGAALTGSGNAVGSSAVTINAGGIGVAAALIACALVVGLNIAMLLTYNDQARRIDRMQDYLNAIHAQAPWLKPPSSKDP